MTRDLIAGGMYGDCLPSGFFCVLIPKSHCLTHLGIVPLPIGETYGPLFVRCTDVGGFRFAGQAHDSENPAAYERVGSAWAALPPPCFGVSPVIYDLNGVLHCSNGSVGSQGYRYVNAQNQIISGDATYGPFHGLFEYTYLEDGLWIGQGATDGSGVRAWDGVTLRQLELGNCRFIRANRVNDRVALAFSRPEGVVLIQTTMAELRALPPVGAILKEPGPINTEKELTMSVPNRAAELTEFHQRWNGGQPITVEADKHAFTAGFMLFLNAKDGSGRWGRKARPGTDAKSKDTAGYWLGPQVPTVPTDGQIHAFDLIAGGTGAVHWDKAAEEGHVEYANIAARWFPVLAGAVQPDPVKPPPVDKPLDLAPLTAEIKALRDELSKLAGDVDELQKRPALNVSGVQSLVESTLTGYEVNGKSAVSFGHQHLVKLGITKRR